MANTSVPDVCLSDYIAADDLGGKERTVKIAHIAQSPELPGGRKGKEKKKPKSVLVTFDKARKGWICNLTNQWSMAILFGTKSAADWIGKRVTLRADVDIDTGSGQPTLCIRVASSPDAEQENARVYAREWNAGQRQRGELCRRLKRAFRMLNAGTVASTQDEYDEPTPNTVARAEEEPVFEDDDDEPAVKFATAATGLCTAASGSVASCATISEGSAGYRVVDKSSVDEKGEA